MMDVRVQDFLDDKLQSAADLDSLDSLLDTVRAQQDLLRKQLEDARQDYSEANQAARKHTDAVRQRAQMFQKEQEDIDRRLLVATQSETSDEAVKRFEASTDRLRKLDMAAGYVDLLNDVEIRRAECLSKLGKDDDAALEPYRRLQNLVADLQPLQEAAEGAAPHLLDHIVASVYDLRQTVQIGFSKNLEGTLNKINWPTSADRIPLALEDEWTANIGRLLDLQLPILQERERDTSRDPSEDPPSLLPFDVLVRSLEQRFAYHFYGNKPSNNVEKPEIFLNHFIQRIDKYSDFIQTNIQPILLRHFHRSDLAFTPAFVDATTAFITAMMPMVQRKLEAVAEQLANRPAPFSHLMQEVIRFDSILQESYGYTPNSPSVTWRGLSHFLLTTKNYFPRWLGAERTFARSRYQSIIDSSDAGELDIDATSDGTTKPSKAAVRVNDLLETVTERYRHLSSYVQKIQFLKDIQIGIFDHYFQHLWSGLEAYRALTTTVGRSLQGFSKEDLAKLQGVNGLDRICRVLGSAEYLERAMRDWSDDVFFLELWAELDYRFKNPDIQTPGDWQELRQKTSSTLGRETDSTLEGALFDETAASFSKLRLRSENTLLEKVKDDVRQALRPYAGIATWTSLSTTAGGSSVSSEIQPTIGTLTEYLRFLRQALGRPTLRRVTRQICHVIQGYVWDNVLLVRTFSTAGATQIAVDMRALCACIDDHAGPGQAQAGMRRLLDGITLLSLPVRGEIRREQPTRAGDEDDGESAWDDEDTGEADTSNGTQQMSLFQAERLIFLDNETARKTLEQLRLETLNEADARNVLKRRVEVAS